VVDVLLLFYKYFVFGAVMDITKFMKLGIEIKHKGTHQLSLGLVFIYPMLPCLKNLHSLYFSLHTL
jgi:hypothetical protein